MFVIAAIILCMSANLIVDGELRNVLPAKGECFANKTHWGDDIGIEKLPPCWEAYCDIDRGVSVIILRTDCSAGFDAEYSRVDQRELVRDHCYPSNRGELPGRQCCGGYKICAHRGTYRRFFNIVNFYTFINDIIYQPWFGKY